MIWSVFICSSYFFFFFGFSAYIFFRCWVCLLLVVGLMLSLSLSIWLLLMPCVPLLPHQPYQSAVFIVAQCLLLWGFVYAFIRAILLAGLISAWLLFRNADSIFAKIPFLLLLLLLLLLMLEVQRLEMRDDIATIYVCTHSQCHRYCIRVSCLNIRISIWLDTASSLALAFNALHDAI